ncbi:AraC-like DNA-binding protein [Paenibacillus mucilaginosus]|uniref:AraC family transcriptional regulator n=1 Tax=Paenibacillus mucilaginosus TaxID=61624 RepID=UPI003D23E9C0
MQRIKAFMLHKPLLIRIILSYLLVGLVVIGALTIIVTSRVSGQLTGEITSSTDRAIEQSYNTASVLLNSTYNHFAGLFTSTELQPAFYGRNFSTPELGRIGSKLYEAASSNPLVHSVYLFNFQEKLVFSSLSTVRPFDEFYDRDLLKLLESTEPYRSGIFIPRRAAFELNGRAYDQHLISIVYLQSREDRVSSGAMVLNLDQRLLQNMVMNGTGSRSFQSMIINRQGTVVSHSDSTQINRNLSDESYVEEILGSRMGKGTLELTRGGKDHRAFYIKSESLGWTFIGLINYETLLGRVHEIKRFILWVTAILLGVVLLSAAFFTRMIYSPIHRLITDVRRLHGEVRQRPSLSELDMLSGAFSYLEQKVQDLQVRAAGYQSARRRDTLRMLTAGGWTDAGEMARKLQDAGIHLAERPLQVCLLRLDAYGQLSASYSTADLALLKYALCNIAEEVGGSRWAVTAFEEAEDAVTLIVSSDLGVTEAPREEALPELLQAIQQSALHYLKLSVSAAIGTRAEDLAGIPASWTSAYHASRYRLVLGRGCLIPSGFEAAREPLHDGYASAMEKQVVDSIKLGDLARTRAAVEEYTALLQRAPYEEMMLLLTQLLISTARTAAAMGAAGEEFRLGIGYLGQRLYQWETLTEIREWYLDLCGRAVEQRDREASRKNRLIVDRIKAHIHEHYTDPTLTVESLVEVGGLSTNYMRRVFKEISGVSINVYLSEYRFEKAKELLLRTEFPANRIGEMVGFENTNYFYVSFKKYCGRTPDHFRKTQRGEGMDEAAGRN